MQPYPPFPPNVELTPLVLLSQGDFASAFGILRAWNPACGIRDPSKGLFGLQTPIPQLELILLAEPPQTAGLDEETRNYLRIMAVMTQFANGENDSGSTRWSPGRSSGRAGKSLCNWRVCGSSGQHALFWMRRLGR